ncbi:hypothetical protein BS639_11820 [Rouxiella silvae]|uniref:Insertion element IS1 protein InsA helix-turn-helix domain-containing protein n=1 Tax=Rouxiella silvae TaxID=1646373 RepID=A0ABX3U0Z4_9GAMM|nr:hypothetical protein BS639_11820 [Rouxiella silvae]
MSFNGAGVRDTARTLRHAEPSASHAL